MAEAELGPELELALGHDAARRAARFAALLDQGGMWVIEADSEVAGSLHLDARPGHLFLSAMCVSPSWQGRGLGRWAVQAALERQPPLPCRVEVLRGSRALAFWQALGFLVIGEDETDIILERPPRA